MITDEDFPRHEAMLMLTHNEYRNDYQTVAEWLAVYGDGGDEPVEWVSAEQRAKALQTGSVWDLHWYPDTPIGFYRLLSCDLPPLLEAARSVEEAAHGD